METTAGAVPGVASGIGVGRASPPQGRQAKPVVTDAALLAAVAEGDSRALAELYERFGRQLFGYLFRLAGDRMLAEEVLQDTLLAVWRSAGSFEGRSQVRTWLFGVARRQAHNRLRLASPPEPVEVFDRPDAATGLEDTVIAAAGGTAITGAVARLPAHHRDVISLVLVAGLPLAEVAEALGVPVGTVKSRLFHARAALARTLAANNDGDDDCDEVHHNNREEQP